MPFKHNTKSFVERKNMIWNILLMAFLILFPRMQYADVVEATTNPEDPIEFVIVIPSYNNEKWCIGNLESVMTQTYPHFTVCYINDCSSDKTGELVDQYVN